MSRYNSREPYLQVEVDGRLWQDHVVLCVREIVHPRWNAAGAQGDLRNGLPMLAAWLATMHGVLASNLIQDTKPLARLVGRLASPS